MLSVKTKAVELIVQTKCSWVAESTQPVRHDITVSNSPTNHSRWTTDTFWRILASVGGKEIGPGRGGRFCIIGGSCHKHIFVAMKDMFCRDKHVFVATKVSLSRQNYVSWDKSLRRDKNMHTFAATKDVFCSDKTFVATKIILVAAPANDIFVPPSKIVFRATKDFMFIRVKIFGANHLTRCARRPPRRPLLISDSLLVCSCRVARPLMLLSCSQTFMLQHCTSGTSLIAHWISLIRWPLQTNRMCSRKDS